MADWQMGMAVRAGQGLESCGRVVWEDDEEGRAIIPSGRSAVSP